MYSNDLCILRHFRPRFCRCGGRKYHCDDVGECNRLGRHRPTSNER